MIGGMSIAMIYMHVIQSSSQVILWVVSTKFAPCTSLNGYVMERCFILGGKGTSDLHDLEIFRFSSTLFVAFRALDKVFLCYYCRIACRFRRL